jgi:hypothetical protein
MDYYNEYDKIILDRNCIDYNMYYRLSDFNFKHVEEINKMEKCCLCDNDILSCEEFDYTEDGNKCHKDCIEFQQGLEKEKNRILKLIKGETI